MINKWTIKVDELEEALVVAKREIEGLREALVDKGFVVTDTKKPPIRYRTVENGEVVWTYNKEKAIRFARREDADMFCAEVAWFIIPYSKGKKDAA